MPKKFKYKNISKSDQVLIGYGLVKAGETIEVEEEIANQNFELQEEEKSKSNKKGK